ncbi:MAG TPA: DUF1178 family protein [Rhizobiaceae bacterium]|nr:DUF1178 family protein [Rhizobiaceae bacterium]
MIRYSLSCDRKHDFDGWFRSGEDYEKQRRRGLVTCPHCGSGKVEKTLMAPNVSTARTKEKVAMALGEQRREAMAQFRAMAEKLRENSDYVGDRFAEEARKIHFGETEERGIHGEASLEEVKNLLEDGIGVLPLPPLPEDHN